MKFLQPTKAQLAIKEGENVTYRRDDGTVTGHVARSNPSKLGGHTWVVWLSGVSGCVALTRCNKMEAA